MPTTVYVIESDPDQRAWIESSLARSVDAVESVADGATLLARMPCGLRSCLVASAEPDAATTLKLVRELRDKGVALPVIVLGPHSAFRVAVDIARLEATDFLEHPVSALQLCAAVRKALNSGT
jgi:FixJ family two-component response regulator